MSLTRIYNEFFNSEKAGGIILVIVTVISLALANSPLSAAYTGLWHMKLGHFSLLHIINDGLMTIFFLLIGLELEREIYSGELSSLKKASLPFFAAIGGMIVPALIYLSFNGGSPTSMGAGIPMATDIAFALGILSLLGNRVPSSLKIFLTALAVIDDLGAIIIIAVAYTSTFSAVYLASALAVFGILLILNRLKVMNLLFYITGGVVMWYLMYRSGVHATVTGVLLAFTIPYAGGTEKSPSFVLQHILHKPVAFIILPVFALANTGIVLEKELFSGLAENYSTGIIAGLFFGKPAGIFLFSLAGVALGLCSLPPGIKWSSIVATGFLGGIGFTMSFFIAILSFGESAYLDVAKIAVLIASLLSGITGYLLLKSRLTSLPAE